MRADLDGLREHYLTGTERPPFCRPGWGCRYCKRPTCEWEAGTGVGGPDPSGPSVPGNTDDTSSGRIGPERQT